MSRRWCDWIVMGPEPHLASCLRCGGTVAMPFLPIQVRALRPYLEYAIALHRDCRVVEAAREMEGTMR